MIYQPIHLKIIWKSLGYFYTPIQLTLSHICQLVTIKYKVVKCPTIDMIFCELTLEVL